MRCSEAFLWDREVLKFPAGSEVLCYIMQFSEAFGCVVDIRGCPAAF